MELEGIEPSFEPCHGPVLPLNDSPKFSTSYYQSFLGWPVGLEPTTSGITTRHSDQLSYGHPTKDCPALIISDLGWDRTVVRPPNHLPSRNDLVDLRSTSELRDQNQLIWCLRQGSNLRRSRLQRDALPTELPRHNAVSGGSCRGRTCDLCRVMAALYQLS